MKIKFFTVLVYVLLQVSGISCLAGEPTAAPKQLRVDMGDNCVIRIVDYFDGELSRRGPGLARYASEKAPVDTSLHKFGVPFTCGNNPISGNNSVAKKYGAILNIGNEDWEPLYPTSDQDEIRGLRAVTSIHNFSSANASGFYKTQDADDGLPRLRDRAMTYCLFGEKKHVCGFMIVMRLNEPKTNQLPHILKVLRSVEFLDPDVSDETNSAAPDWAYIKSFQDLTDGPPLAADVLNVTLQVNRAALHLQNRSKYFPMHIRPYRTKFLSTFQRGAFDHD
ncbi:hypothetical protein [Achromobacter sp. JUb104]|uniref:hypothetical protein n=1 Tax=Achromobacter sp. JUb104 TaxID=2940590 RepID=UPI0021673335|nr:hypothetical protein [Achromobacter sp. JUb104]MCS3507394.1 hypothetical protein [Achromobacter sp. JUb104]